MSTDTTETSDRGTRELYEQLYEDAKEEGDEDVQAICEFVLQSESNEATKS